MEESEEVKKAKLEAKSQVALHAMLAPAAPSPAVNQRSKLMELARLKKVGQQRPSPPVRKAPTNPYAKSSSKVRMNEERRTEGRSEATAAYRPPL